MTADQKRPIGPPRSAGVLARYAQAYARELGIAEGRVRAWVAYMILADNGTVNMEIAVTYRGQPWTSISVDIARAEAGESEVEWVDAIVLTHAFGVTGPAALPCLPLRFHVAQKLHGTTLPPRPGKQNERFRDLVDLLLLEALFVHDYVALREACGLVFRSRNTHPWPPNLDTVPPHWAEPFAQLSRELQLPETDLETALVRLRSFVARIVDASS